MKVVFDTNIIIDLLAIREPFYESAFAALSACDGIFTKSCITSNTVTDIAYILHRYGQSKEQIKAALSKLFSIVEIFAVDSSDCKNALNSPVDDFEDAVLSECASRNGADYIITRNKKDYAKSSVNSLSPAEFVDFISEK
ncbi:MAG: PIN domain-containing protein [Treponema sp.]|nr:PIN domain-containing protein [Treponema sp.]